jgi:hypothetical protein
MCLREKRRNRRRRLKSTWGSDEESLSGASVVIFPASGRAGDVLTLDGGAGVASGLGKGVVLFTEGIDGILLASVGPSGSSS